MQIEGIYIYPVKSLAGIPRSEAIALERGFEFDRRWMLVDENREFITQRTHHSLALLGTEIREDTLFIYKKHFPEQRVSIPLQADRGKTIRVSIWEDSLMVTRYKSEAENWLSDFLGKKCKLVFMKESAERPVDPRYALNDEQVSFADAFPYLLITQASLDDLNNRLFEKLGMNRFRPNIVVGGANAYDEDTWAEIRIGEAHFKVAKPCVRCVLTTINQETGNIGKEPLQTLASYRVSNNKILFGQNLIALNEGRISSQDKVEVIRYK